MGRNASRGLAAEFELASADAVQAATVELEEHGFSVLHPPRTEPWGQTVSRILTHEGLIVGLSYAPWFHDDHGAS